MKADKEKMDLLKENGILDELIIKSNKLLNRMFYDEYNHILKINK